MGTEPISGLYIIFKHILTLRLLDAIEENNHGNNWNIDLDHQINNNYKWQLKIYGNKQYVNINFHYFWLILEIQIKVLVWELAFFFIIAYYLTPNFTVKIECSNLRTDILDINIIFLLIFTSRIKHYELITIINKNM